MDLKSDRVSGNWYFSSSNAPIEMEFFRGEGERLKDLYGWRIIQSIHQRGSEMVLLLDDDDWAILQDRLAHPEKYETEESRKFMDSVIDFENSVDVMADVVHVPARFLEEGEF